MCLFLSCASRDSPPPWWALGLLQILDPEAGAPQQGGLVPAKPVLVGCAFLSGPRATPGRPQGSPPPPESCSPAPRAGRGTDSVPRCPGAGGPGASRRGPSAEARPHSAGGTRAALAGQGQGAGAGLRRPRTGQAAASGVPPRPGREGGPRRAVVVAWWRAGPRGSGSGWAGPYLALKSRL